MPRRFPWWLAAAGIVTTTVLWIPPTGREESRPRFESSGKKEVWPVDSGRADDARGLALRHAKVWRPSDPHAVDLSVNPPDPTGTLSGPIVRCRYRSKQAKATTPKFDCVLPHGEIVKVKYGRNTGEVHAEVAASRLLTALGFGADRVFMVPRVRCYGCPRFPFQVNWLLDKLNARELLTGFWSDDRYTDFTWVSVERRFDGADITAGDVEGWAWWELDQIDTAVGATREELDAFRLIATFIAHWDNKQSNQRLVCLAQAPPHTESCPAPFALIQDLGATFGPNKVDLEGWKAAPIWADSRRCLVGMRGLPYDGGTFPDAQITEGGRTLIARQLGAVSERQIVSLFSAARFPEFHGGSGPEADVNVWARVFQDKVREIATAGPCPSEPEEVVVMEAGFDGPRERP